jgi:preprotein translocase subunit SecG
MTQILLSLELPLLIFQLLICPIIILLILLQSGKGDDLGTALGGGGSGNSVLGTGGTSRILVKLTVIFAIVFMVNSITLAKISSVKSSTSAGLSDSEPLVGDDLDLNLDPDSAAPVAPETPEELPVNPE